MISIEKLTEFFGWCSILNMGMLIFTAIMLVLLRGPVSKIHSKIMKLSEEDLSLAYFQFMAQYKIFVIIFNIVPYVALKMMVMA